MLLWFVGLLKCFLFSSKSLKTAGNAVNVATVIVSQCELVLYITILFCFFPKAQLRI